MKYGCAPFVAIALFCLQSTTSQAMQVSPMRFDISTLGRDATGTVNVANNRDEQLPVELRVNRREVQADGEQKLVPDDENFLVFPPTAIIPPGGRQSFRVQWLGEPLDSSESYYVNIAQVPVELPEGQSGVQVLMSFNVAMHVVPPDATSKLRVVDAKLENGEDGVPMAVMNIANEGTKYAYSHQYKFEIDGGGMHESIVPEEIVEKDAVVLLPPSMTLPVKIPLDQGASWAGPITASVKLAE